MKRIPFIFTLALFLFGSELFLTHQASAQFTTVGKSKEAIDYTDFKIQPIPAARIFIETLKKDLTTSGHFTEALRGRGDYKIVGEAAMNGPRLNVKLQVVVSAGGSVRYGHMYNSTPQAVRSLAHRYADEILLAIKKKTGIANTSIAYLGEVNGKKEVFLCDYDGGNPRQYTNDRSISMSPTWDPSGQKLLYTSFRKGFPDVYEISVANGQRNRLANFPGLNTGAVFAPNGRDVALVLSKDGNPEIYIMNRQTLKPRRITKTKASAKSTPTWSPDGKQIAFVSDHGGKPNIYIVTPANGRLKQITFEGRENVQPNWSNNNLIAYSSKQGSSYEIRVYNANSGKSQSVLSDGRTDFGHPSWSPNGRHLVTVGELNYVSSLYILDTKEGKVIPIVKGRGSWSAPSWSPHQR